MMKFEKFRQQELEGWEERAADYGTLTARVTTQSIPALLGAIRVRVGMKVLDICTGPGFAAGAADAIGASAEGLDFASSMVRIASGRFPGVRFWQGDALAIDAKASGYDAAICNFGVFHLTDPQQAFSEAFRIIRPGGRYAFSQWVSPQDSELFSMVFSAVMRHADMSKVPPAPDAFAYSDPDLCRESLAAAGFTDIEIINVPGFYHASAADFWPKFLQFSVRTPIIIDCQTGDVARAIEADVERAINSLAVDGEVTIAMPSFVVVGIRPEEVSGN